MPDLYDDFASLTKAEDEGTDYRICVTVRDSSVAIIAPHGGLIEPGTSEIARAIAKDNHILYCFEGIKKRPHGDLHITSTSFDEPQCLDLIKRCTIVVAVHGLRGRNRAVDVGGRDRTLRDAIYTNLDVAGFTSNVVTTGGHAAVSRNNICNRGQRGAGVQLEITKGLRKTLLNHEEYMSTFAMSVRQAILSNQPRRN